MRQKSFSRCRGSVGEILFILAVVLLVAALMIHPRPRRRHLYQATKQAAQLFSINAGLDLYADEVGGYPPSDANDPAGVPYCGAMKLAEALMGRDSLGLHSQSVFRADGLCCDGGEILYPIEPNEANLKARKGPYIVAEQAEPYRLADVYGKGHTGPFAEGALVLCDAYIRKRPGGVRTGMPILYYRANVKGTAHDANDPDNPENIYDYRDNQMLVSLGVPGAPNTVHPLSDPKRFYMNTQSDETVIPSKPFRADSYILISAGYDGLYGTADDICNFQWKYRPQ